ncbi:hypothetical protein VDG1235_744 [Verrucomicrobiia bacterium DG1235]|nr:hypothetical protein VDG1235_744 [Verrucomicrobiae bacterium DG1235]
MMDPQKEYTLPVHGIEQTGYKEQFLRQRDADEIAESGLSSGCGDFTSVFIDELKKYGTESIVVEGAEISVRSLQYRYSGHSVVAVPPSDKTDRLILVDPTSGRILDEDWNPQSESFEAYGSTYWIGYMGDIEQYPAHNSKELQELYDQTLKKIPSKILEEKLFEDLKKKLNQSSHTTPASAPR